MEELAEALVVVDAADDPANLPPLLQSGEVSNPQWGGAPGPGSRAAKMSTLLPIPRFYI